MNTQEENTTMKKNINNEIRKAKKNYYSFIFKKNKNDMRMTWQTI